MGKTKKDIYTLRKKDLVTDKIHRKAGPHKVKEEEPFICPECRGTCGEYSVLNWFVVCSECDGTGIIWK